MGPGMWGSWAKIGQSPLLLRQSVDNLHAYTILNQIFSVSPELFLILTCLNTKGEKCPEFLTHKLDFM
jgi:hypothetical protein